MEMRGYTPWFGKVTTPVHNCFEGHMMMFVDIAVLLNSGFQEHLTIHFARSPLFFGEGGGSMNFYIYERCIVRDVVHDVTNAINIAKKRHKICSVCIRYPVCHHSPVWGGHDPRNKSWVLCADVCFSEELEVILFVLVMVFTYLN